MKYDAPIIIGLAGPAGSGKDTVRQMLESDHGFSGLAFADPIRSMVSELLSYVDAEHYAQDRALKEEHVPRLDVSYRELAQTLGTEWGRDLMGADFWVRIALARISRKLAAGVRRIVISDVRFANEVAAIREAGGRIWRITRPGLQPVRAHVSEQLAMGATEWDAHLCNDGSIEDLWVQVSNALAEMEAAA